MIEVLQPGFLTTIQDLGRDGFTHLGVSPAGAADSLALRIGNLIVGNPEGAAALEFTLDGGSLLFHIAAHVAITEADASSSFEVKAGGTLHLRLASTGARAYLCVAGGGIALPEILGSASTHLPSGLGGYHGRPLRRGDRIAFHGSNRTIKLRAVAGQFGVLLERRHRIRVSAGLHLTRFSSAAAIRFASSSFLVQPDSNRQGLRLCPSEPIAYPGEILSEGVALGAIQILPGGSAILMFVDSQTTGGYPIIANVISADLPSVGQLRPGDRIRFVPVTLPEAAAAWHEQEALLNVFRREMA